MDHATWLAYRKLWNQSRQQTARKPFCVISKSVRRCILTPPVSQEEQLAWGNEGKVSACGRIGVRAWEVADAGPGSQLLTTPILRYAHTPTGLDVLPSHPIGPYRFIFIPDILRAFNECFQHFPR